MAGEEPRFIPVDDLMETLHTSWQGLSSGEVESRRSSFGPNTVVKQKKLAAIRQFARQLKNPLIIILLLAAILSIFLAELVDALIIIVIVFLSLFIDFFQEYRAERAVELLKEKISTMATVIRGGVRQNVHLSELIPGDIIVLSAGDIVPADARVILARDFFVDQSALTGESFPVEKTAQERQGMEPDPSGREQYLFMSSPVISGSATAVVVKTGMATEYGKIAERLTARPPETEFERGLKQFSFLVTQIIFILVIFVFFTNAFLNHGVLDSLLFAIALAVGLTPELLPMILTVNLAKGALAMSEKGVIVKHLASIQNFGSMDVLCTDKTGTLTENRITLIYHVDAERNNSEQVLLYSYLNSFHQTGLKSPLDEAILKKSGVEIGQYRKIDEIPFDFIRKRISVVVEKNGDRLLIAKGAPEEILKLCTRISRGNGEEPFTGDWQRQAVALYDSFSGEGFRILAVASRKITDTRTTYSVEDETDLTFHGFVAFIDPPKETAHESLLMLHETGIDVKIITGDNERVTRHICATLDFPVTRIIEGNEIAGMDGDTLASAVEQANIFTRVSPPQKERIIRALMKNNHVVGYLGDGINDAPSIRAADIGITVDNAVDIAKESADIVLLKKDLRVLRDGILEGRKTFGNTMKYIMMGTSSNFGNMISVAAASLFLPFLPLLPVQILLNNLLYDMSQSTIPTDTIDGEYVLAPKRWDIGFIKKFLLVFGPVSSLFDILTFITLLFVFHAPMELFRTAWFLESLCTQTIIIFAIRTTKVPFYKSRPSRYLVISSILVVMAGIAITFTPIGDLFGFVPLTLPYFLAIGLLVTGYIVVVEFVKTWFYRDTASHGHTMREE
ncbi:magnesium-translocating P-type ATPase [Methanoregula sp.]|uniref:magnesium-translocating P-type ATPase n=1 Tax=Methanoregula sp. TaxID=2052170 RepID=UPI002369A6E4|nr:magnesium-translocating P-type ATPase [Methanoregula sp.]MDD1685438.1 magnesium-translocating P-type ATPase [Methanoregula sp.]